MSSTDIHITSRAVIINHDYILLVYDPSPQPDHYYEIGKFFYYLPGGHVNLNEGAKQAVIREIKEEAGYEGIVERFLGIFEHAWEPREKVRYCHTHEINLIFKVDIPKLPFNHTLSQKEVHVAFKWVKLSELSTLNFLPEELKDLIPKWLGLDLEKAFESSLK